jgi:N-methylhydantoinase A
MNLPANPESLKNAFFAEHHKAYGYAPTDGVVELVNVRLTTSVIEDDDISPEFELPEAKTLKSRNAFFDIEEGFVDVPVFTRTALTSGSAEGPMIIEEDDATCVIPSNCTVSLDKFNNIVIELS